MLGRTIAALAGAALLMAASTGAAHARPYTYHENFSYQDYYNFENPCVPGDVIYGTGTQRSNLQWTQEDGDMHVAITVNNHGTAVGSLSGLDYGVHGTFSGTYQGDPSEDFVSTLVMQSLFTAPGPDNNFMAHYRIRWHIADGEVKMSHQLEEVICTGG